MLMRTNVESIPAENAILAETAKLSQHNPALRAVAESFGPLLAIRAELRQTAPGWRGPLPELNIERFCNGVSLLSKTGFQDVSEHLAEAGKRFLPVVRQVFPVLVGATEALADALSKNQLTDAALVRMAEGKEDGVLPGASGAIQAFLATELLKPFRERQALDLKPLLDEVAWRHGRCPVCGGVPHYSELRKIKDDAEYIQAYGGQRWLRCGACATEWRYKRVSCPSCGAEDPDDLVCLRLEGRPLERADACRKCKTYCLCQDAAQSLEALAPDVAALSMLPLEMLARQEGYRPLAAQPWSLAC
jgi:FdhE protein